MYYFCNFLKQQMKGYTNKVSFVEVSDILSSNTNKANCSLVERDGRMGLVFSALEEKVNGVIFDFIGNISHNKTNSTLKELKSTDENPIIVIGTKSFKVYNDSPAYIKYYPVEDGVLVALIEGVISVEDSEGNMVALSRYSEGPWVYEGIVYGAEAVRKLSTRRDKESGIAYSNYVVSDCVIANMTAKDGSVCKSLKFTKENFNIINKGYLEECIAIKKEELRLKKEEEERIKRKREEFNKAMKLKKQEESAKVAKPRKKKSESTTYTYSTASEGAQAFLSILNGEV